MSPVNVKIRRGTLSKVWNTFMRRSRPFLFFHLNAQVHIIKRNCLWNPRTKASWSVSLASLPFSPPVPALWWLWLKTLWVRLYTFACARVHLTSTSSISAAPASLLPHRTQRKLKALCRYVFNGPCFFSFCLTLFFSFHPHPSVLMLPSCLPPSHWWIWSRARDGKSGVSKWNIDPVLRGLAFTLSCVLSYRLFRSACNRNYYRRPGRVITWHGGEGAEEGPLYISSKGVIYRTCYLQPGAAPLHPLLTAPPARSRVFLNLNSIWLTVINHTAGSREVYQTAAEARGEHNSVRDPGLFTAGCESTVLISVSLRRQFVSKSYFFRTVDSFLSGSDSICDPFFSNREKNPVVHVTPNLRRNTLGSQKWTKLREQKLHFYCVRGKKQL